MTAIADAELDKLFWQCGPENDCDAFCAALNARLEAADALDIAVWKLNGVGCVGIPVKTLREIEAAHTAYRQSKERR